jgi:hypothetical protein
VLASRAGQANNSPSRDWDNVLSKQFQNEQAYKDMQVVASQHHIIQQSPPNGPGDLAMLTAFMRMTDPKTGVRPSEMAAAQSVGNALQQAQGWALRLTSGQAERLPDEVRNLFKQTTQQMLQDYGVRYKSISDKWKQRALAKGADPDWVIGQDADINQALEGLGSQGQSGVAPARQGHIKLRSPDGRTGDWPADQPIPAGFTQVQ